MDEQQILLRLAVAALGGLAVGVEREWSARQERDHSRFGGVRTFLLLGLLGGLGGVLLEGGGGARLAPIVLAGGVALVAVAYFVSAWRGTIDATTEVAGVVVLAAGAFAGGGSLLVASAVFAGTALVLVEKSRMHAAVERLQSIEVAAGARFAVLALVVLPLLPTGPFGPGAVGVEPRKLWALVLLFAGLSFAGYVALRVAGPERGLALAGLLGGVVSSTAVTLNFARDSRRREELTSALALGVLAASAVLPARVGILSAVVHAPVARALLPALLPALAVGAGLMGWIWWRRTTGRGTNAEAPPAPENPLRLRAAIQMTVLFQVVLWILAAVEGRFGERGLLGSAALLGLTDLDALTYSASRLASEGGDLASSARALLVGMASNTVFKGALAVALGSGRFGRLAAAGFLLYLAAFGLGWFLI
jgi:uncharacterized membrane protein (DUF4010 family)